MFSHYQNDLLGTTDECLYEIAKLSNISPKAIDESIERISEWFSKQPHLCKIKLDRDVVKRYLKNCNWSIEKTKERMNNFYIMKSLVPDIYVRDPDLSVYDEVYDVLDYCVIPKMGPKYTRVIALGFNSSDPELYMPIDCGKFIFTIADIRTKIDNQLSETFIVDCANTTFAHLVKALPVLKDVLFAVQGCYSVKIANIHILNVPTFAHNFINILKKSMKKKLADRIQIHKNIEDLLNFFTPDLLPSDLGGTQPSRRELTDIWRKTIRSQIWKDWLRENDKYKSDESLRIKKDHHLDKYYSMSGSFRKLDID